MTTVGIGPTMKHDTAQYIKGHLIMWPFDKKKHELFDAFKSETKLNSLPTDTNFWVTAYLGSRGCNAKTC
jgi:hypothetical protein